MPALELTVLSLRYSSWSMRPWLALRHAGLEFTTKTVDLPGQSNQQTSGGTVSAVMSDGEIENRRKLGSVTGLFPVLRIDGTPIHEALAICEYVAEAAPSAGLWPDDALARAQARAVSSEMATGFGEIRTKMSSHPFARVPGFRPDAATRAQLDRVLEIWNAALEASGGPFLFGRFSIADCMYFPMLTRFATYGVEVDGPALGWWNRMNEAPCVTDWRSEALRAPRIPVYDDLIREKGGDPDAATG